MSDPRMDPEIRIWREPPPEWPLTGSWALTTRLSVLHNIGQVSMYLDGARSPAGGQLKPLWRSVPVRTARPLSYADGIPMLTTTLWEFGMALQGMTIRFEQS